MEARKIVSSAARCLAGLVVLACHNKDIINISERKGAKAKGLRRSLIETETPMLLFTIWTIKDGNRFIVK